MSEKSKRKPSKESPWEYPKPFRYEVKGELHHLIDAIQALHQEEYSWNTYIVTIERPLDESALYQFEVVHTFTSPKSNSKTKLQGTIHRQNTKFIVEGFAFVDLRGNDGPFIGVVVLMIFFFIVIAASPKPDGLKWGAIFGLMCLMMLGMLFMSHLQERGELIEYLLKGLETYTPPPVSEIAQTGFQEVSQVALYTEND